MSTTQTETAWQCRRQLQFTDHPCIEPNATWLPVCPGCDQLRPELGDRATRSSGALFRLLHQALTPDDDARRNWRDFHEHGASDYLLGGSIGYVLQARPESFLAAGEHSITWKVEHGFRANLEFWSKGRKVDLAGLKLIDAVREIYRI